jgi:DNA polymerase III subunit delta
VGVWMIRGDDEALVAAKLHDQVHRLVGGGDRSMMVDEFVGEEYQLSAVVDAAQTPPFLTDRRVVVARDIGRFGAELLAPLVAYVSDPMPSTELLMTTTGGRLPKALLDALKAQGAEVIDADPPQRARDRQGWYDEQFAAAGLRIDAGAKSAIIAGLGEDLGRLGSLCATLSSSFDEHRRLTLADVEPFLGPAGSVVPWELTDAIDRGDTAGALDRLTRMMGAGERHSLQIMAVLHSHYTRMLRLDGTHATDEASAAAVLGIKGSTYPARKALDQLRRLGSGGLQRGVALLAAADLDLRGAVDWPPEMVVELLVARLSKLAAPARR